MELWGAAKVAEETGMSVSYSQKLIKRLNDELAQKGFLTFRGKVPKQYFLDRCYGGGKSERL